MMTRQTEPVGTGQELALRMAAQFPGRDWVAELAERSDRSRDFVEWHLQQELEPPAEIVSAATEMLAAAPAPQKNETPEGGQLFTEDDLPFSGLPGNLGKLHRN